MVFSCHRRGYGEGCRWMIAAIDFFASIFSLLALIMLSLRHKRVKQKRAFWALFSLIAVTTYINFFSAIEWYELWFKGVALSDRGRELFHDYFQVLQPVLWGLFLYIFIQTEQARRLKAAYQQTRDVLTNMPVILRAYNHAGELIEWNKAAEQVSGYAADEVIGNRDITNAIFPSDELPPAMAATLSELSDGDVNSLLYRKDRSKRIVSWYCLPQNAEVIPEWQSWDIGVDITERYESQQELIKLATTDLLTGLPNRYLLLDRLKTVSSQAAESGQQCALAFVDIDDFRALNDTLGHSLGDEALKSFAEVLHGTHWFREQMVARASGDAFAIIVRGCNQHYLMEGCQRLLDALGQQEFDLAGSHVQLSASIGLCLFPDEGVSAEEIMKNAELAMYSAKASGKRCYEFFSDSLYVDLVWERETSKQLFTAIEEQEFTLNYQPQICLQSEQVMGFEALIRWPRSTPDRFIPLAERNGMIHGISEFVMVTACEQLKKWQQQGLNTRIAINLSALQFYQSHLCDSYSKIAAEKGVDPSLIELEITEGTLIKNVAQAIETITQFNACGFTVSLDDFGTGYSSFAYLKSLPVSKIKIDRSFIKDIHESDAEVAIVNGIINLAHNLGMQVLAEGVELRSQFDLLRDLECDAMQGWLYAPAMPPDEVTRWLNEKEMALMPL
ncbi:EAL domain-containing protein [Corallincola holothuriorum]|uniref:EAL domain-containing protein n=2 Tax=Corallincola holothuriorum TaxID=2282215 RepID=A0A368N7Y2_9GAMM|nr:EAL domain-containing protein [Corallincola holothuriorum]